MDKKYIDADRLKQTIADNVYLVQDAFNNRDCGMFWTGGIEKAIDEQPAVDIEPRWVPVKERLPEEIYDSYWVCTDSGYQCECRWTNKNPFCTNLTTNWHWKIFDIPQYTSVIAWMPLPEPYKGGEEE